MELEIRNIKILQNVNNDNKHIPIININKTSVLSLNSKVFKLFQFGLLFKSF
mgnify:CR=1 FL=1